MGRTPMNRMSKILPVAGTLLMFEVEGRELLGRYIPRHESFLYTGMNGEKYLYPIEDVVGWKYIKSGRSKK